jgi:hypothetical protein
MNEVGSEANFHGDRGSIMVTSFKQLLGLENARLVSVHELVVRMSLGKRVPLERLPKIL